MLMGVALFFGVLAGSVAIQAQRIEGQHEIDRLESETVAAVELNRALRSRVAVAESPARIMDEARALQMVEPGTPVPLVTAGAPAEPDGAAPDVPPEQAVTPDDSSIAADDATTADDAVAMDVDPGTGGTAGSESGTGGAGASEATR